MGPGVSRRRWRPGLPLEGPPGLCPACPLRIPGPGPAAGRRSSPARRAAVCLRCAGGLPPQLPPPASQAEAEWPLQGCLQQRRAVGVGLEVGLHGPQEKEVSPRPISLASPIEHGSLVATQLITKTRLGVLGGGALSEGPWIFRGVAS